METWTLFCISRTCILEVSHTDLDVTTHFGVSTVFVLQLTRYYVYQAQAESSRGVPVADSGHKIWDEIRDFSLVIVTTRKKPIRVRRSKEKLLSVSPVPRRPQRTLLTFINLKHSPDDGTDDVAGSSVRTSDTASQLPNAQPSSNFCFSSSRTVSCTSYFLSCNHHHL